MRKILILLLLAAGIAASGQQYNNEWIKFSQTYFKIKVASDGVYRIPKSLLDANGLGSTQVQYFELWRNGEKVPSIHPCQAGCCLQTGFLEFWANATMANLITLYTETLCFSILRSTVCKPIPLFTF